MTYFKPRSMGGGTARHLLVTAFSIAIALLLSYEIAAAQSAGSQTAKLIGTIKSDGFIGAVLSDAKGDQVFYRLKEKLPDGSQIVAVRSDSISLKSADGTPYEIYIAHDMPHETKAVASVQKNISSNPSPPAEAPQNQRKTLRNGPTERPLSYYEKRHGRRKSDLDND
jgi:hypothetical protein